MKQISYTTLQKKYPGKIVAIDEKTGRVIAFGDTALDVDQRVKKKGKSPEKVVFLGPIEKPGTINVYIKISLPLQEN